MDHPIPTPAELETLNVLWRCGPATLRDVRELMERAFEGSAADLARQALSSRKASMKEIEQIRVQLSDVDRAHRRWA